MAVEMLAARVIAPFYGTSLLIWTLLLFSILVALTAGYYWGGKRADANPRVEPLAKTLLAASVLLTGGPYAALWWLQNCGKSEFFVAHLFGAIGGHVCGLLGAVALMCLPVALLGSVGPYVIRLCAKDPMRMGTGAGSILGLSTIGSIFGTYLPALVGIPYLGTLKSFLVLAGMVGFAALVIAGQGNLRIAIFVLGILGPAVMTEYRPGLLRPGSDVIYENESVYNTV